MRVSSGRHLILLVGSAPYKRLPPPEGRGSLQTENRT
jgi:hypothetical protein